MPEPVDGLPFARLSLSPGVKNLAVLHEDTRHRILEIIGILPDGRLLDTQRVTHPVEQHISAMKWVSQEELLLICDGGETCRLSTYRLEQGKFSPVLTTTIDIPARVLAASSQHGSLEVLLAISTKDGIRFGLFFPQTNLYQMISAPWSRATFGAWHPKARLLGVNAALIASDERLQGLIYGYGDAGDQIKAVNLRSRVGRQCVINAFDEAENVCITACSDDGFLIPGSHTLETGETHWFEGLDFSAEALGFSENGELILCGGPHEADWRYVVIRRSGVLEESIDVDDALLLHPVFCQNPRYLLAQYQTPGIAPTLCRYDRVAHTCERILHLPELDHSPQIKAHHWWAQVPALRRMPVISFAASITNYERIVLFLHGGPHLNTMKSYSPLLSRLVEQGFWVVAPNFPGSIGYGSDYERLIRGDWGGIDVRSVIELAELLVQQGKGINRCLVLYGVSYGGYLALLAAGLRPDLWNCVIAGAPITDLQDLYTGAHEHMKDSLRQELGPLLEDKQELALRSPISYVHALKQLPVLLLHGANDIVCPTRQSRCLAEILADRAEHHGYFAYREFSDLKHEVYSERFWVETAIQFLGRHIS